MNWIRQSNNTTSSSPINQSLNQEQRNNKDNPCTSSPIFISSADLLETEDDVIHNNNTKDSKDESIQTNTTSSPYATSTITTTEPDTPFFFTWTDFWDRNFYISDPLTWSTFYTARGYENIHIYFWVGKDLGWTTDNYWLAMIMGCLALAMCIMLSTHAIEERNMEELYMLVALVLWLAANFVWMSGEVFYNDDDYVVPRVAIMMETAISWILFYHFFLKPFKIVPTFYPQPHSNYYRPGLTPRFSYFATWRQYEHIHTLCWLGKDLSWNRLCFPSWVICMIPTVLINLDFIIVTFRTKRMLVDCLHYITQLMWVLGNVMWALGQLEVDTDDTAFSLFDMSRPARARLRWVGAWVLFSAYFPIILLYSVWIPLTLSGRLTKQPKSLSSTEVLQHSLSNAGSQYSPPAIISPMNPNAQP